ncbi:hypothetical protein [Synechocystis sp. PCC 7509]|uniref:hypothetical protein n=1 Tax=Synechocystis sp. PCC 7509 TaxID=927677 RepID=UPI0002ACD827|nr:hypothetical protein [Synechocystis sp. PCC 7509]
MSLKKVYLLIGMTTASIFLSGIAAQAQTTESPERNTLIIAENTEEIKPSFESKDADYNFMAQLSAPQNDTTQTAPLDDTIPSDTTQTAPLDNTVPSDSTPTAPSTQTPPSDYTPTTPSTQTPPSDGSNPPFGGVNPGRATRSGSSYIGVGGNIGIGGDTGIGEGSFSVLSKVGLTRNLSVRPSVLFGDNVSVLLPVTVDFPAENLEITRFSVAPYIGGGAVISTGDDTEVGVLLTGGIDVPINSQFTATAGVNVGFVDETDVGVILGVGYNFSGL